MRHPCTILSSEKQEGKMDMTVVLPEDCISRIISFTSPRDACRSSVVSPAFKSAADSDAVWDRFLPSDYQEIISSSSASSYSSTLASLSKKDLYFYLCQNPVVFDNGTMSFSLDRGSGKKCYMVGARRLYIVWGDASQYWTWREKRLLPESRFAEVAELIHVWWFDVRGSLKTRILSTKTNYLAYLVFKFAEFTRGFESRPLQLSVYFEGREIETINKRVLLDPPENMPPPYQQREDGWMEIEIGEFFNEHEDDVVVCRLFDFDGYQTKAGLFVEGIEFRPKNE